MIFSGFENFVSKIDHSGHRDWPEWMGTIDFGALKLKLLSSIVAISAIQLLKQFMSIGKIGEREIFWLVIIHVVFVTSSVLLALSDRIASGTGGHGKAAPAAGPDNGWRALESSEVNDWDGCAALKRRAATAAFPASSGARPGAVPC